MHKKTTRPLGFAGGPPILLAVVMQVMAGNAWSCPHDEALRGVTGTVPTQEVREDDVERDRDKLWITNARKGHWVPPAQRYR